MNSPNSSSKSNSKPRGQWTVKGQDQAVFGPASIAALQEWAKDGRLAPDHMASKDGQSWVRVSNLKQLEMNWVVEVAPSTFYGPIHAQALTELIDSRSIPPDSARFCREAVVTTARPAKDSPEAELHELRSWRQEAEGKLKKQAELLASIKRERDDIKSELANKELEFEAERQELRATAARAASDLARSATNKASLEKQLEQSLAKQSELEQRLRESSQELRQQSAQISHSEHIAAELRRQQKEMGELLRKALRIAEAETQLQEANPKEPIEDAVIEEIVIEGALDHKPTLVTVDSSLPPKNEISLNQLEAQAQREIQLLKQVGNIFGKRK